MMRLFSFGLMLALAVGMNTNIANAQWSDDFDSYSDGELLDGQNGWSGWWLDPDARGAASNTFSNSAPNSIEILNNFDGGTGISTDAVNKMGNPTSGVWTFTCNQYLPSGGSGNQFFIMLNKYTDDGSVMAWTTQLRFEYGTGMAVDANFGGTTPIVFDQWVEIRMEIDLDADTCEEYYNDVLLFSGEWTQLDDPDDVTEIGALDLYGGDDAGGVNGPAYYDDCVLQQASTGGFVPPASYSVFRGMEISGSLADFVDSDDVRARYNPGFVLNSAEAPVWLVFDAVAAGAIDFQVESQAGTPGLSYTVEAWNWVSLSYDVLGVEAETFNADSVTTSALTSADQIDGSGNVRSRVGWRKTGLTINFPWEARIDQVGWNQ